MEAEKLDQNLNRVSQTSSTPTIDIFNQSNDDINRTETLVTKAQSLISGSNIYQMMSNPRGFCLIINNVDFDNNRYPRRMGSDEETQRLNHIFTQLYFEVIIKRNLCKQDMLQTLRQTAKHNDLKKHDCLVIIILSHGYSGQIMGSDNQGIEFEKLLSIFNNQNCHQLIKKPKMFFFNCCRGSTLDFGPQLTEKDTDDDQDVADAIMWPHVPIISDIMVCYSTIDGYVSWRNEHNGTWFGSALAMALAQYSYNCELNQLLTTASDIVHRRCTKNGAKQAIEWKYRAWTKSLYFNPGFAN